MGDDFLMWSRREVFFGMEEVYRDYARPFEMDVEFKGLPARASADEFKRYAADVLNEAFDRIKERIFAEIAAITPAAAADPPATTPRPA